MQLIRAINKANKSNNSNSNNNNNLNNQTSSTTNNVTNNGNNNSNNKVVIVAPPTAAEKSAEKCASKTSQKQQNFSKSVYADATSVPPPQSSVSPSASLPPLKKRTSIVKQSVPPPVPPRSPRSKSKFYSKSFGHSYYYYFGNHHRRNSKNSLNVDSLQNLVGIEVVSGTQKVQKWLESVEVPARSFELNEISRIPEDVEFKSVKKLAESFTTSDKVDFKKPSVRNRRKVSDCNLVQSHIANYNSLNSSAFNKISTQSANETDSGIESSFKTSEKLLLPLRSSINFNHQFSRDGELV
jgi:hypothetical protein